MDSHVQVNVQKALETCQEKGFPFVYWDSKEVDAVPGLPFPNLAEVPAESWELYGEPVTLRLDKAHQVQEFKEKAKAHLKQQENSSLDIGYAIIHREENLVTIQGYIG